MHGAAHMNTYYISCKTGTVNLLNESVSGAIKGTGQADLRRVMAMGDKLSKCFLEFHYGPCLIRKTSRDLEYRGC